MSNGITANTDKKLFDRWKDNFKDFFIEDEQKNGTKTDEEKEKLIKEENNFETEPIDQVMEMAEEKMIEHPKSLALNGNRKEDLEGIPEVENEETQEEVQDEPIGNEATETIENENDQNHEDTTEDVQTRGEIDADEEAFLIKETVEASTNDNQQSRTPFFKILEKFPFMKKKTEIPMEKNQEGNHDQVDINFKAEAINGLPSYHEAVCQEDEGVLREEANVEESINREELSNEENTEIESSVIVGKLHAMPESPKDDTAQEEEVVTNGGKNETENSAEDKMAEEPKQAEKKFRFKFQFFTDKK